MYTFRMERDSFFGDFFEILNYCGFDIEKANTIAAKNPPVVYPRELIEEAMKESCMD